jgi:hypothetical protein
MKRVESKTRSMIVLVAAVMLTSFAWAESTGDEPFDGDGILEPGEDETAELQRATQNPVADLISVPFQNNTTFETGPLGRTQNVLNIQPVIPFNLNDDWNLITRTIVPIINQPPLFDGMGRTCGLGNVNLTTFLSPREPVEWIWGVGPVVEFPTHADNRLGSDNWSAGPSFVALKMDGPWVYGGLVNQIWSFAGDDPEVNKLLFQPFINYNMADGWALSASPIITADWSADSDNQWTIPIGGGISKLTFFGKLPVNMGVQAFYNIESPRGGGDWSLRFQMTFLLPK